LIFHVFHQLFIERGAPSGRSPYGAVANIHASNAFPWPAGSVGRSIARFGRWVSRRTVGRSVARSRRFIDRSLDRSVGSVGRPSVGRSVAWLTGRGAINFVSRTLAQSVARIGRSVDIARSVARRSVGLQSINHQAGDSNIWRGRRSLSNLTARGQPMEMIMIIP
jgi:hypothetical protein